MFGGFGNNQNTNFGNTQANPGFGASPFASNTNANTNTTAGFGFGQPGQQQNPTFGSSNFNPQGFGSTGFNQTASSFNTGATTFPPGQTAGFGGSGGSSFGGFGQQQQQQQPSNTFQSSNTFGMTNTPTSGFGMGSGNITSTTTNQGTGNPSYAPTQDKESGAILSSMSVFHSISAMPAYKNWSFEELRFADYGLNKKYAGVAAGGGFGNTAFGSTMQAPTAFGSTIAPTAFGATNAATAFGASNAPQTSTFGGMNTTGGFGFGASTTTAFGAQPQGSQAAGVFGASSTTPAFGATAGGFGQTQGATAFGQKPAATTAWGAQATGTAFGTSPAFGAQPTAAAPTSTWGAPAASAGFGIQTTAAPSAFGQPAQPAGGLFGAKPASVGFSFAPTTTAPTASTGLFGTASSAPMFGATQQQATPAGGLFGGGASKPGFSFGTAASTSAPFGTLASTTSNAPSLFGTSSTLGQPATSGGGLFGAPAVTTQPAMGLFGTPSTSFSQPTGLFGTSTAPKLGGFGSFQGTAPQTGMAGMGTLGGGMFGQTPGSTNNLGTTSLFGGMTPAVSRPQGPTLTATIDRNPFGVNPLFTPSKAPTEPSNITSDPLVLSVQNAEKKKPILTPHFKVTPRSTSKIKLRGFAGTSPVSGQGLSEPKSALKIQPTIVKEQRQVGLDSRFTPRKTMTKLIISETPEPSTTSVSSQQKTLKSGTKEVTFDPSLEEVALSSFKEKEIVLPASQDANRSELSTPSKTALTSSSALTSPLVLAKSSDYMIEPPISDLLLLSDEELHAVSGFKVSLEGVGWVKFLRPVDLLEASPTGTRSGIVQIPGSVVILEPKICTIYPDENVKPPCGFGLNVPAEINIEKCWPLDKSTKKPVLDESDPRHDRHMQKLERMPGTKWLGFHNPSGTWRFRVEHFSRYGLIDEDSDEEIDDRLVPQEREMNNQHNTILEIVGADEEDESIAKDSFAYLKGRKVLLMSDSSSEEDNQISHPDFSGVELDASEEDSENIILAGTSTDDYDSEDTRDADENDEHSIESFGAAYVSENKNFGVIKDDLASSFSSIRNAANSIQQRDLARKVQTMKSSLFSASRESRKEIVTENSLFGSTPLRFDLSNSKNVEISSENSKREKTDFSPERGEFDSRNDFELLRNHDSLLSSPKKYRKSFSSNDSKDLPTLSQSVLIGNEIQIADASLFMSRCFRVGWESKVFIRRSSQGYSKLEIIPIEQLSGFPSNAEPQLQCLKQVLTETSVSFISVISEDSEEEEELLGENESSFVNVSKIPKATLSNRLHFSQMEAITANEDVFSIIDQGLWKLASALWDDIILPAQSMEMNENEISGIRESLRKEKFSAWLRWAINSKITVNLKEKSSSEKIWHYLVSRRIDLAINEALHDKNFRLASLLTQINGPSTTISTKHPRSGLASDHIYFGGEGTDYGVIEDISAQMRIWQRAAMTHMDSSLLGVWKILSGNMELWDSAIFKTLNDWKQFFGLYFWYGHGGHLSIHDVSELYVSLYSNNNQIPAPKPDYSNDQKETDICFNLIKLFVDDSTPLEQALKPSSFSSKTLDYLSAWIIYTILAKVKNLRDFQDAKAFFTEHKVVDTPNEELSGYPVISSVSSKADMVTSNVVNQLEIIGLWQWAIFVSLFLTDHYQRSFAIKRLLGRYYPINDNSGSAFNNSEGAVSSTWEFLVNQIKVPTNWIHESRALNARNICQPIQESVSLFDANLYDSCHTVVISKVAPVSLFSANHSFLCSILTALDSQSINNWEIGGNLILNYLKIVNHVPNLIKKAELSQTNASVADRSENLFAIEELKDVWIDRIRSIIMLIENINPQRDSVWHKSDISTKSLNFISEKIDNLLLDSLQVVGGLDEQSMGRGSGLSFVISESREWFSSILSA